MCLCYVRNLMLFTQCMLTFTCFCFFFDLQRISETTENGRPERKVNGILFYFMVGGGSVGCYSHQHVCENQYIQCASLDGQLTISSLYTKTLLHTLITILISTNNSVNINKYYNNSVNINNLFWGSMKIVELQCNGGYVDIVIIMVSKIIIVV